jgi:phage FluMu protein Com
MATYLPTHCPHCKKVMLGEVRSFCAHCNEILEECDSRWFSTVAPVKQSMKFT